MTQSAVATELPPRASVAALAGLSETEVQARRAQGLGNTAPAVTGRTYRQIIVENLFTFINI